METSVQATSTPSYTLRQLVLYMLRLGILGFVGPVALACPWLIAKFIDQQAEFLYVPTKEVPRVAEETGTIRYDIPDVEFTHVGELYSFDAFL